MPNKITVKLIYMEEQDILRKQEALDQIRNRIDSCFDGNGNFALHKADEIRGNELIAIAIEANVSLIEFREIAVYHLVENYRTIGVQRFMDMIKTILNLTENVNLLNN